ncbi:UPF0042 nucleotide-binding protein [Yoonia maricola]|uniref:UPF0042 nucleotide-binding protein n=1 Tax=Yoonia maricola TaxID=420999 RepID=A0A2M8W6G1_9RHOB|nr:RNase adapter RapZ [Yoonia maricola]PJI86517.1 UPF0042 nucleotide-binding protein [Yoonia maricola]
MTKTGLDPVVPAPAVVLVTGPSGAGRSTAINALEDLGFEVIDNLPLSLLPRLLDGPPPTRPLALGVDVRNRDFSTAALIDTIDRLTGKGELTAQVLYMDAAEEELVRRYSETRRRHPLAPAGSPLEGIAAERALLVPVRARADVLIDTTGLSPHDAKVEVEQWFGAGDGRKLGVTLHSFSYKRGLPRGMDIVMDCRFLQNPHWVERLRKLDGRNPEVAAYVAADPRFSAFFEQVKGLADLLLPAHRDEGKAHLSIGFGCTGGKHRSVTMTEKLAEALAQDGWHVSKRHRELERRAAEENKGTAV